MGVTTTLLEILVGLLLVVGVFFFWHLIKHYNFWANRGVPYKKPVFPYGSLKDLALNRMRIGEAYANVYWEFQGEKFCGVIELNDPVLVVRDPELIKKILVKDFNYFVDRDAFEWNPKEWINYHLFAARGDYWKKMRNKISPAFTSGKMKTMCPLMDQCGQKLIENLNDQISKGKEIDVKDTLAKFTMDIIATCAFGVEINSLVEENSDFYKIGGTVFKPSTIKALKHRLLALFPELHRILNIQRVRQEIVSMMENMISSTVEFREKNSFSRGDFIDTLIKLKHNESILDGSDGKHEQKSESNGGSEEGLTLREMISHAFVFFAAGYETASSAISFCLYELARHQLVQERLAQEIDGVLQKYDGKICYDALQEMKYMEQVISEALRKYPTFAVLNRRCTQTYKIPGSDLVLERGRRLVIPVSAIQNDPQYYPDPSKFDPDRFSPENIKKRHQFVYLPFGEGPRYCIGMRIGLMQTKVGLATILSRFRVKPAPNTPESMDFQMHSLLSIPKHFPLNFVKP